MAIAQPVAGVPWLTGFSGPAFFETALGPALIVGFVLLAVAPISIAAHRWWMTDTTLMLWIAVAIAGCPLGAIAWFAWGRPAVRKYRDGGAGAISAAPDRVRQYPIICIMSDKGDSADGCSP